MRVVLVAAACAAAYMLGRVHGRYDEACDRAERAIEAEQGLWL